MTDPLQEPRRQLDQARDALERADVPLARYDDITKLIEQGLSAGYALAQRVEDAERLLRELAPLAPTGSANVHEEAERQRIHQRVIELLGLPDPGEFVRSDYWLRLERQALRQEEK